ncbi:MAG: hypothetical protein J6V81_03810 [Bacteroidales bacterium]|nr:hypothetical protein [Bacteroidales bacterium]
MERSGDNGAGFAHYGLGDRAALSGIITTEWNWRGTYGMEVPWLPGAERAGRSGGVRQPWSGTADGTAFQDGR